MSPRKRPWSLPKTSFCGDCGQEVSDVTLVHDPKECIRHLKSLIDSLRSDLESLMHEPDPT